MTPEQAKEKVLERWPDAYLGFFNHSQEYIVWSTDDPSEKILGRGSLRADAWLDAARRLEASDGTAKEEGNG